MRIEFDYVLYKLKAIRTRPRSSALLAVMAVTSKVQKCWGLTEFKFSIYKNSYQTHWPQFSIILPTLPVPHNVDVMFKLQEQIA